MNSATATMRTIAPHWTVAFARKITTFPALISAVLAVGVFCICRYRVADPDLWWHLRNAQYFASHLRFPNIDTYSFTAAGAPWINHEWLSELFYYAAFRGLGFTGIFLVFATALSVMMVAVFWLALKESDDPFASILVTMAGALLATVGFGPRTQHFGWLCFVAMYAILLRFRSERRAPLWLLPLIFAVWINCHGSWLIGLAVYAMFVLAGLVPRDIGRLAADRWSMSELKKLTVAGLSSVAALFANPFGYRLVLYPYDFLFRLKLSALNVQEFASVDFRDARGKIVAIVLGAVFVMAFAGRKRWRILDALLVAFALYCGLTHMRFLLLAGIMLPPILAPQLGRISSWDRQHEHRVVNSVLLAVAIAVFVYFFPSRKTHEVVMAKLFPVRAVEFLRAHPQQGHIFNHDVWGGYLEWTLPEVPIFYDTRVDIFQQKGVVKDYYDAFTLKHSQEILNRYHIDYVLFGADESLTYFLSKVPEWERVYGDDQAVIFRRTSPVPPCKPAP